MGSSAFFGEAADVPSEAFIVALVNTFKIVAHPWLIVGSIVGLDEEIFKFVPGVDRFFTDLMQPAIGCGGERDREVLGHDVIISPSSFNGNFARG